MNDDSDTRGLVQTSNHNEPEDHLADNVIKALAEGDVELCDMEESIYGAWIAGLVLVTQTTNQSIRLSTFLMGIIMMVNVCLQVYLIVQVKIFVASSAVMAVRQLYANYEDTVIDEDTGSFSDDLFVGMSDSQTQAVCMLPLAHVNFILIILIIWTSTSLIALMADFKVIKVWFVLPTPSDGRILDVAYEDGTFIVRAASMRMKWIILLTTPLVKIVLQALLWWIGTRWLLATNNFGDLILNAVALAFVTDIDEMLYNLLVPQRNMDLVGKVKTEYQHKGGREELKASIQNMVLQIIIMPTFCYLYLKKFQHVLPNYNWDVHEPCNRHSDKWVVGSLWSV